MKACQPSPGRKNAFTFEGNHSSDVTIIQQSLPGGDYSCWYLVVNTINSYAPIIAGGDDNSCCGRLQLLVVRSDCRLLPMVVVYQLIVTQQSPARRVSRRQIVLRMHCEGTASIPPNYLTSNIFEEQ